MLDIGLPSPAYYLVIIRPSPILSSDVLGCYCMVWFVHWYVIFSDDMICPAPVLSLMTVFLILSLRPSTKIFLSIALWVTFSFSTLFSVKATVSRPHVRISSRLESKAFLSNWWVSLIPKYIVNVFKGHLSYSYLLWTIL